MYLVSITSKLDSKFPSRTWVSGVFCSSVKFWLRVHEQREERDPLNVSNLNCTWFFKLREVQLSLVPTSWLSICIQDQPLLMVPKLWYFWKQDISLTMWPLSTFLHASVVGSFLYLSSISWQEYPVLCLLIYLLMDTWGVSLGSCYECSCHDHSCSHLFVLSFLSYHTWEWNYWVREQMYV